MNGKKYLFSFTYVYHYKRLSLKLQYWLTYFSFPCSMTTQLVSLKWLNKLIKPLHLRASYQPQRLMWKFYNSLGVEIKQCRTKGHFFGALQFRSPWDHSTRHRQYQYWYKLRNIITPFVLLQLVKYNRWWFVLTL